METIHGDEYFTQHELINDNSCLTIESSLTTNDIVMYSVFFKKGDVELPSSPADRQKLKQMLDEIVGSLRRKAAETELIREITKEIKNQFKIPAKQANRMAKTSMEHNFLEQDAEHEAFMNMYEALYGQQRSDDQQ